ncbi:hypothetical protein T5B8_18438 [Salinisphaera sp. T5B8]
MAAPKAILPGTGYGYTYSICTLVTDQSQYEACRLSFERAGFDTDDCEYLYIDNTAGNTCDGFAGVNAFLDSARGRFIVFVHQDVRADFDKRPILDERLAALEAKDSLWAICGNAGRSLDRLNLAIRITDPHGADRNLGRLPARTYGLDENFFIVERAANLAVNRSLNGFHFYATELCFVADVLGQSAYVIDFHIKHLSPGNQDSGYYDMRRRWRAFRNKKQRAYPAMSTSDISVFSASSLGSPLLTCLLNWDVMHRRRRLARVVVRLLRRRRAADRPR